MDIAVPQLFTAAFAVTATTWLWGLEDLKNDPEV